MGLKLIIGAYFALVGAIFVAGIVMLSVGYTHESQAGELDGAYMVSR